MATEVKDDRRYLDSHEWAKQEDGQIRVGISDFAQDELGDIVYVELPSVEEEVDQGDSFGVIESIKAVSDLYAPVGGTVTATNDDLIDQPELVNASPFDDGWMLVIDPDDPDDFDELLDPSTYEDQLA